WSFDQWQTSHDSETVDTGLGLHVVDLPSHELEDGREILFTFYWKAEQRWEGVDFRVKVGTTG
ncbi:MAG TPA: hypothetical protein VEH30_10950, partial [Terriglobales bacterium]|nr:hypothetical protein [Terriglobales bacterium]